MANGGASYLTSARLSSQALREVHAVLRMWPMIKGELADCENDALHGGYCTDFEARSRSSRVSNPTMARAMRLATDPHVLRLSRLVSAIERAQLALGGAAGKRSMLPTAMRLHYLDGHTWGQIAAQAQVSRQTVNRWDQRFRVYVWQQLGRRV